MTKKDKQSLIAVAAYHRNEAIYQDSASRQNWRTEGKLMRKIHRSIAAIHRKWEKAIRKAVES